MRELSSTELQAVSGGLMIARPICRRPVRVVCRPERPERRCGGTPVLAAR